MVNGEIFFARYEVTIDVKATPVFNAPIQQPVFPPSDFDIIASRIIPISGGSGKTNAVVVIIARAKT